MVRSTLLTVLVPVVLCAQDPRDLVRRAIELDRKEVQLSRNYTFLWRQVDIDLDGAGKPKKTDVRTWDVTLMEGSPYKRLVARNDKPLSAEEQKFEADKLTGNHEGRKQETREQRERRIAEWHRRQEKQREAREEIPEAFNFKIAAEEPLNGRPSFVIDATPKPGYKPRTTATSFLPHVKVRIWIDKATGEWAKVDMEIMDTITLGGFLVRVAKGGRLMIEQTWVNNEVFLPRKVTLDASARLLLVKGYHKSLDITFSDYKKFQTDSRIVSSEER